MNIAKLDEVLKEDYQCRRQMMVKRFQVTLESFAWGEKQKVCIQNYCHCILLAIFFNMRTIYSSRISASRTEEAFRAKDLSPVHAGVLIDLDD